MPPADRQPDLEFARQLHEQAYRDVVLAQFGAWDAALQDGFFEGSWNRDPFNVKPDVSPKPRHDSAIVIGTGEVSRYRRLRVRGLRDHGHTFPDLGGFILAAVSKSGAMLSRARLELHEPAKTRQHEEVCGMYVIPKVRGQHLIRILLQSLFERAKQIVRLDQLQFGAGRSNAAAFQQHSL